MNSYVLRWVVLSSVNVSSDHCFTQGSHFRPWSSKGVHFEINHVFLAPGFLGETGLVPWLLLDVRVNMNIRHCQKKYRSVIGMQKIPSRDRIRFFIFLNISKVTESSRTRHGHTINKKYTISAGEGGSTRPLATTARFLVFFFLVSSVSSKISHWHLLFLRNGSYTLAHHSFFVSASARNLWRVLRSKRSEHMRIGWLTLCVPWLHLKPANLLAHTPFLQRDKKVQADSGTI